MKTTDLIPILLYHLKDGDKYGLELINACSECSNGQISVKQPTLYSVVKKLEKSKFISSYWQDSDIGGKRHYFKITENGLSQLETYPPLEDLVKMAVSDDIVDEKTDIKEEVSTIEKVKSPSPFDNFSLEKNASVEEKKENIFDKLFAPKEENIVEEITEKQPEISDVSSVEEAENNIETISVKPEETTENKSIFDVLDTNNVADELIEDTNIIKEDISNSTPITTATQNSSFNVFDALDFGDEDNSSISSPSTEFELKNPFFKEVGEKSLEEKTNLEINEENTKLLNKNANTEEFLKNKNVSKFTEKNILPTESGKKEIASLFTEEIKPATPTVYNTDEEIKYQDYVDIKNDKNVKKTIRTSKIRLYKVLTTSIFSLIVILSCFLVVLKSKFSPIFTVFSIVSSLYIVYYACHFIGKFKEQKYSLGENFTYNYKKKFLVRISIFSVLLLAVLIYNLIEKNTLLSLNNFANFLAPIIISALMLTDYIFALVFYKKL